MTGARLAATIRRPASTETPKLRCPHCGAYRSRVVDSRVRGTDEPSIRRTRVCLACSRRYGTAERVLAPKSA